MSQQPEDCKISVANSQEVTEKTKIDLQKLDVTGKILTQLFEKIKIPLPRRELAEVAQMYSKALDTLILKEEDANEYTYVGGEFAIVYLGGDKFKLEISLYFKDKDKEWIKVSASSKASELKYLTDAAVAELTTKHQVKFDVAEPVRNELTASSETNSPGS